MLRALATEGEDGVAWRREREGVGSTACAVEGVWWGVREWRCTQRSDVYPMSRWAYAEQFWAARPRAGAQVDPTFPYSLLWTQTIRIWPLQTAGDPVLVWQAEAILYSFSCIFLPDPKLTDVWCVQCLKLLSTSPQCWSYLEQGRTQGSQLSINSHFQPKPLSDNGHTLIVWWYSYDMCCIMWQAFTLS